MDKSSEILEMFYKAAKKQKTCIDNNAFGHSPFCNTPTDKGFGSGRCNCGVADIISALKKYEEIFGEK